MSDTKRPRTAKEAENDVEAARADLVRSIDNLEARLSPNALVDQGLAYFQADGRRHIDGLASRIQANPLSLLLIGIGLAWLAFGPKATPRSSSIDRRFPDDRRDLREDGHRVPRDEDTTDPYARPSAADLAAGGPVASSAAARPRSEVVPMDTDATKSKEFGRPRMSGNEPGSRSTVPDDTFAAGNASRGPGAKDIPVEKGRVNEGGDPTTSINPNAAARDSRTDGKKV